MSAAPLKVLVVDDEPPIRKLLRMGLSTQGYDILEAPNGRTSLELLAQNPDLVILDLGLPDMQGLELLRMMRARNEAVPIVVLSSRGDEVGKVQALDLGADDYITKPFGMDELLARMRAALRHQLQVHGERPIAIPAGVCSATQTEDRGRPRAPAFRPDRNRNRLSPEGAGLNAAAGHWPAATRNRTMLACAVGRQTWSIRPPGGTT